MQLSTSIKFSGNIVIICGDNNSVVNTWNPLKGSLSVLERVLRIWTIDEEQDYFLIQGENYRLCKICENIELIHEVSKFNWLSVPAVFLHPVHPILAIGSAREIELWDIKKNCRLNVLLGHSEGGIPLAFSEDGSILFSTDSSDSICCWNLKEGIAEAKLMWRSEPHSLVLHGMTSHDAVIDSKTKDLLQTRRQKKRSDGECSIS